jgi:hypothetical protein
MYQVLRNITSSRTLGTHFELVEPKMGNSACKRQRPAEVPSDIFPAQSDVDLDWNDEGSIHRRTALNCLHNYALGKIEEQSLPAREKQVDRKRLPQKQSIKFADQIEQTKVYEKVELRTGTQCIEELEACQ